MTLWDMYGGNCEGMMGPWMMGPWTWLFYLLLLGLFVAILVWFLRQMSVQQPARMLRESRPQDIHDPREILRLRYARGELSRDEYLSMLKDLSTEV